MDFELFRTKDEALAFIKGLECGQYSHTFVLEQLVTGEWKVAFEID